MDAVVEWLMTGDPAIRWQTMRDLLDARADEVEAERARVATEGWGAEILALQRPDGTWGRHVYGKWTGTFYTVLLLRDFGVPAEVPAMRWAASLLLDAGHRAADGGLNFSASWKTSETCISGMGLAIVGRYGVADRRMEALVEYLLRAQMADGGWNCRSPRATHSSFHTTISALEGLHEWQLRTGDARAEEALERGREFLLAHRLFRSHRTGTVVKDEFTRFHFPPRWHYDVLRGLDHLRAVGAPRDERIADAIALVERRRQVGGHWTLPAGYGGGVHFELETVGQPSRWNTLRALRVLRWWAGA